MVINSKVFIKEAVLLLSALLYRRPLRSKPRWLPRSDKSWSPLSFIKHLHWVWSRKVSVSHYALARIQSSLYHLYQSICQPLSISATSFGQIPLPGPASNRKMWRASACVKACKPPKSLFTLAESELRGMKRVWTKRTPCESTSVTADIGDFCSLCCTQSYWQRTCRVPIRKI